MMGFFDNTDNSNNDNKTDHKEALRQAIELNIHLNKQLAYEMDKLKEATLRLQEALKGNLLC